MKYLKYPIIILFSIPVILNYVVIMSSSKRIYSNLKEIPTNDIGLVLGTNKNIKGNKPNRFFKYRIDATYKLYSEKKISYIIVSGDGKDAEDKDMMKELVKKGVPKDVIYLDSKGYSTVDSILRLKEVFGVQKVTIISQQFHNQRAIFISLFKGVDAIAYNAETVPFFDFVFTLRDFLARLKSFYDIFIYKIKTDEKIEIKRKVYS